MSPKLSCSREASKERSPSPPAPPPHPPIADEELVVGARVKVHYGSGSHRKLYQAKIVKVDTVENKFVVHYLGWNTRYDESVPKSRIVEVMSAIAAASSDSGVSNNDQGENGNSMPPNPGGPGGQKIPRSISRSHVMEKSSLWRRRRSSGGSTHSLPIAMATQDEGSSANFARKSSSISTTQWRKVETAAVAVADDEGDESGKEGAALLSTYKAKVENKVQNLTVEMPTQSTSVKRPASANATSESRDRIGEETTAVESGPPPKRGRRAGNSGTSSSSNKRKKSLDESDEEEDTKNGSGNNSRRVSKRLRGVKASIEEELQKQQEEAQSDNEEEKTKAASASTISITTVVKMEIEETKVPALETSSSDNPAEDVESDKSSRLVTTSSSKESEEIVGEKDSSADENKPGNVQAKLESVEEEEQPSKNETPVQESTSSKDPEKRKETPNTSAAAGAGNRRTTKVRRRRRNYSQMVTDHRRPTANKAAKRDGKIF